MSFGQKLKKRTSTRIHGWDLSLNHSGFVELDSDGEIAWFGFVSEKKGDIKLGGDHMPVVKHDDGLQRDVSRLVWWWGQFVRVCEERNPTHVGIEHYAYAASGKAYQIGEMGGMARCAALGVTKDVCLRLHDPLTLKMYVTHDGGSKSDEVARVVRERWPESAIWDGFKKQVREDLCTALGMAKLVWLEIELRAGRVALSSLDDQEVRVFNRATKSYPVNILGRDWIKRVP